ncbi:hypothetical protein IAU59_001873 [Kwoniella sp. CBS 9459]
MPSTTKNIVIIGSDLIGTSTAYYLSQNAGLDEDTNVVLVEEGEVGGDSQQYGGGLIGGHDGNEESLQDLAEFSLKLHSKLARTYDGVLKWGYSPVDVFRAEIDRATPGPPRGTFESESTPAHDRISAHFPSLRSIQSSSSSSSSSSIASSAVIDPTLLTRHLCSIFLSHPRCSLMIARATSLTFEDYQLDPTTGSSGGRRTVSGVNVVQRINGVEEIVHVAASSVLISTGNKLLSTAQSLLGEEAVRSMGLAERIGQETRESVVLKPRERIDPLGVKVQVKPGSKEIEIVVRDDGRVHVCRSIESTDQARNTGNALFVNGDTRTDAVKAGLHADASGGQAEAREDLVSIIQGLSPHFGPSSGTSLISHDTHQVPSLSPKSISAAAKDEQGIEAAALAGSVEGFQGIWLGLSHRSDPTLGPGIGYILAERISGVQPTTEYDVNEFSP